jgi:hydroxymethylpyrimidine/phosphomethylpyrimidine kinase
VTSQNTQGVDGIHDIPPAFVAKQLKAVLSDIGTNAIKIGMLSSSDIIKTIADILSQDKHTIVLDPVMVSTSGSRLLAEDAIQSLVKYLLPITHILTPNVPEAELLLGLERGAIRSVKDMCDTAKKLAMLGPTLVLLKGGHLPVQIGNDTKVVDVIYNSVTNTFREVENDYVNTKNTHGTGCTLSAALAGELAKGLTGKINKKRNKK